MNVHEEIQAAANNFGMRPKVYIAGPLTNGGESSDEDIKQNIQKAEQAAVVLLKLNCAPFIPHWNWAIAYADKSVKTWLEMDFAWLEHAEAVYRLPGLSVGADYECKFAKERNIPVFICFDEIIKYFDLVTKGYLEMVIANETIRDN